MRGHPAQSERKVVQVLRDDVVAGEEATAGLDSVSCRYNISVGVYFYRGNVSMPNRPNKTGAGASERLLALVEREGIIQSAEIVSIGATRAQLSRWSRPASSSAWR